MGTSQPIKRVIYEPNPLPLKKPQPIEAPKTPEPEKVLVEA